MPDVVVTCNDNKRLIYHNQNSLQHLLRNKLNMEYFTGDKLKDIFSIYIYGFAQMNKLGNRSLKAKDVNNRFGTETKKKT